MLLNITGAGKCQTALLGAENKATAAQAERTGIEPGERMEKGPDPVARFGALSQRQHAAIQSGSC